MRPPGILDFVVGYTTETTDPVSDDTQAVVVEFIYIVSYVAFSSISYNRILATICAHCHALHFHLGDIYNIHKIFFGYFLLGV